MIQNIKKNQKEVQDLNLAIAIKKGQSPLNSSAIALLVCSAARRQLLLERARRMPHLQRGLRHGLLARQDLLRRQVHRALLPDDQEMPSAGNHPREGLVAA